MEKATGRSGAFRRQVTEQLTRRGSPAEGPSVSQMKDQKRPLTAPCSAARDDLKDCLPPSVSPESWTALGVTRRQDCRLVHGRLFLQEPSLGGPHLPGVARVASGRARSGLDLCQQRQEWAGGCLLQRHLQCLYTLISEGGEKMGIEGKFREQE